MKTSLFLLALCVLSGPAVAQDKGPVKKPDAPKKAVGDEDGGGKPVKKDPLACGRKPADGDDEKSREHFKSVHGGGECHCACNHPVKKAGPVEPPPQKKAGAPGDPPPPKKFGNPGEPAPKKGDPLPCGRQPADGDDEKTRQHFKNVHGGDDCHCACNHAVKKIGPDEPPPQKKIGVPGEPAPKKGGALPCGRRPADGDDEKTREHFKNVHGGDDCHCACNHPVKKAGPDEAPPQKKAGVPGDPPPPKKIGNPGEPAPKKGGDLSCGRKPSDGDDAKARNHFRNVHKGGDCHCDCDHPKEGGKEGGK